MSLLRLCGFLTLTLAIPPTAIFGRGIADVANQTESSCTNDDKNLLLVSPEDFFCQDRPEAGASPEHAPVHPVRPRKTTSAAADVVRDQLPIWSSFKGLNTTDLRWLLPLAATTGILIGTDRKIVSEIHSGNRAAQTANRFSNYGLGVLGGLPIAFYGIGSLTGDAHAKETGLLSGEAMADSLIVTEVLKLVTQRQRPDVAGSRGQFWHSSSPLDSSFPSDHSAIAWTAASVIAREYPGPVTQWGAYGLAGAVSLSRVLTEKHFPSDVLIGAVTGYLIGRYVYRTRHDGRFDDLTLATPVEPKQTSSAPAPPVSTPRVAVAAPAPAGPSAAPVPTTPVEPPVVAHHQHGAPKGSVYVPVDNWAYPALRRLAEMGYIPSQSSLAAPWTRLECRRQVEEAEDIATRRETLKTRSADTEEALRLIAGLQQEFGKEGDAKEQIQVESLYTRLGGIGGTPLRDSYHFGQTLINDNGRPFDRGFDTVDGFSASAESGRFSAYMRGEYQYASGRGPDSQSVRNLIGAIDANPVQPATPVPATSRFEPLEMYAGVQLGHFDLTFGKESLWWGPGEISAFHFSDNAEPFYMMRLAQTDPLILPGPFRYLGKIRTEIVFGKLSGHQYPARPYINAQKIMFALTDNFELGFTRSSIFGGVGHPLTFGTLYNSLFSLSSTGSTLFGSRSDPGDRRSGFDFRWRLPGLKHRVTIFADSLADDDPNPLDNPRRAAWSPGLYISELPWLRRMDFRVELPSTLLYDHDYGGFFIYINNQYHDAYTNKGFLLGSWIGRDSRAYTASSTYWFSARTTLMGQYRQTKIGSQFFDYGGTQTDGSLTAQWQMRPEWTLTAMVQAERYSIPVLGSPQKDVATSVQLTYNPKGLKKQR